VILIVVKSNVYIHNLKRLCYNFTLYRLVQRHHRFLTSYETNITSAQLKVLVNEVYYNGVCNFRTLNSKEEF
jgi:DNA polymerase III alpha subunit (gram-positive type)